MLKKSPRFTRRVPETTITLTTRQRDILKVILDANRPIGSVEIAGLCHLTPRQVNYSIKGVRVWLKEHNQDLATLPGVGFAVSIPSEQARVLVQEISFHSGVHVVLSVSQRQQLLALFLLAKSEPFILSQLEQIAQVSRMTLVKDLDEIESWLKKQRIDLIRKPHFGIQVNGAEHDYQQALAKVLWSETPFSGEPITKITHAEGLVFSLKGDASLLPLVEYANQLISGINMRQTVNLVARAEEQLGGRFTDDAILHLGVIFGIMASRVQSGHHVELDDQQIGQLQSTTIWPVAVYIAKRLEQVSRSIWKPADIAQAAMELLAAPRNEILPGEMEHDSDISELMVSLMAYISQAFEVPTLKHDRMLENGLFNCIVPACFRQRFNLWFPAALDTTNLPRQREREHGIAVEISRMVQAHVGVTLPQSVINYLVVLLRAAFIRNRNHRFERIFVVCPSGMATAQLLAARLNVRFPYLTSLKVTSLRDLTPALVASADLILTIIPLPKQFANSSKVIQVHPLLMPEDIEAITQFLS